MQRAAIYSRSSSGWGVIIHTYVVLEEFCCNIMHMSVVLFLNFTYCIIIIYFVIISMSMQSVILCQQKKRMRDYNCTRIRIFHMCGITDGDRNQRGKYKTHRRVSEDVVKAVSRQQSRVVVDEVQR